MLGNYGERTYLTPLRTQCIQRRRQLTAQLPNALSATNSEATIADCAPNGEAPILYNLLNPNITKTFYLCNLFKDLKIVFMQIKKINIAVDGFSSCGKSTIAKGLARAVGYIYIDSGAMYRAVALFAVRNGWITEDNIDAETLRKHVSEIQIDFKPNAEGGQDTYLNGENVEKEIRSLEIANVASRVSAIGFVRRELVRQQQAMGQRKGVVMDGRDIGTVVFPDAELKLFLTASPEVRAERRFQELQSKGIPITYEDTLANVRERDHRDTTRDESPLRKADDAIELDNSHVTIEEQLQWAIGLFNKVTN